MSKVATWSTSAGSNNASPPDGWPEGMQRSAVNDCAREMMAALAKWYQDSIGTLTTAGGTTAYTLTTNNGYTALSQIPLMSIRANIANTGAVTLAVDGLTAKSVVKLGGTALAAGDLATGKIYLLAFNVPSDRFEILNSGSFASTDGFLAGTAMLFAQAAAPTGWVKGSTHDNKALRLVTGGSGGSAAGTTPFTSIFASRTIAQANLPNFNLNLATLTGSVGTTINNGTNVARSPSTNNNSQSGGGANIVNTVNTATLALADGTVTFGGTLASGGSGTAMDFAVQYVDIILGVKS